MKYKHYAVGIILATTIITSANADALDVFTPNERALLSGHNYNRQPTIMEQRQQQQVNEQLEQIRRNQEYQIQQEQQRQLREQIQYYENLRSIK